MSLVFNETAQRNHPAPAPSRATGDFAKEKGEKRVGISMLAFFALVAAGGFFGWLLNGLTVQWEPGLWPTLDLGFDLGFDAGLAQRVAGLLPFLEEKKDVEGGTSSRDYSGDGGGVFVVYGPGQAPDSESERDGQGPAEFCFRGEAQRKIELGGEIHPQRVVARMENPPRSFRPRSSSGGASLKMEKEWEKAKREEMEGGCATVEEDVIVVDGSERMSFGSPSRGEDGNKRIWGSYLTLSGSCKSFRSVYLQMLRRLWVALHIQIVNCSLIGYLVASL